MLDLVVGKARAFLLTLKPQKTNLFTVEFPEIVTKPYHQGISLGTGFVSAALGFFKYDLLKKNPFTTPQALLKLQPDLGTMCQTVTLPDTVLDTFDSKTMTYPDVLPSGESAKTITFTFLCNEGAAEYKAWLHWKNRVVDSRTRKIGFWQEYASGQNITVTFYNSLLEPVNDVILQDCYPINISGYKASYEDESQIMKFDVTCVVRNVEFDKPSGAIEALVTGALNKISIL